MRASLSLSEILDELDRRQEALDKLIVAYFKLESENADLRKALGLARQEESLCG